MKNTARFDAFTVLASIESSIRQRRLSQQAARL
jgi:hypothetical protein